MIEERVSADLGEKEAAEDGGRLYVQECYSYILS